MADIDKYIRAISTYHSMRNDYRWVIYVCIGMEIYVDENPDISVLRWRLFDKITTEKNMRISDGTRFVDKFLSLSDEYSQLPEQRIEASWNERDLVVSKLY